MPRLEIDILKQTLSNDTNNYDIFIETGTYLGETIFPMEPYFRELYTIEINPILYHDTKNKYSGNKIKFYLGDSSQILKDILPNIESNIVFFMDAHWSGGLTGRGNKDCPLNEELYNINKLFKHNAIIIIDDYRLFGKKLNEDWSYINKNNVLNIVKDRLRCHYHLPSNIDDQDRLILHLNSI